LLVFNLLEQLIHVTTGTSRTISGTSKWPPIPTMRKSKETTQSNVLQNQRNMH
jgi:hypothetical protein